MIDLLQQKLGSMTKALEILYVKEGAKPAARIIVDEEKADELIKYLDGLSIVKSDFKIKKEVDERRQYSDKGIRLPVSSKENGQVFLYLSKSIEKAESAKRLEEENRHMELGIALGYPECCAEFFNKNFPIESKKQNDYTLAALKNSQGYKFPFYTNTAIRHLDLTLLSHFPCSFNCKNSIELAKKNLDTLEKHSRELGLIFQGMLKGPVIYTEKYGVFLLRNAQISNDEITYNGIFGSLNNNLYSLLKKSEKIQVVSKNHIKLEKNELKGDDVGVMLFI